MGKHSYRRSSRCFSRAHFSQQTHIMSDDVLSKIKVGASSWEEDVPESVGKAIKFYELFGYNKKEIKV